MNNIRLNKSVLHFGDLICLKYVNPSSGPIQIHKLYNSVE